MTPSTGSHPTSDSMTLVSVAKSGVGTKIQKECAKNLGWFHLPDRTYYIPACLDLLPNLTPGRDDFLHN